MASKENCWEVKQCGRQPGGAKTGELGVCLATTSSMSGVNAPPPEGGGCGNGLQALFRPEAGRMFPAPSGL